jgi:hypothetical protein
MNTPNRLMHTSPVRLAITWSLFLTLLSGMISGSAAAHQTTGTAPLELPAMVLTPADLADVGMPDYVLLDGQSEQTARLASDVGDWTDQITNDDIQQTLEGSGLLSAYSFGLRLRQNPADIRSDLARDIYGSLHAFSDDTGAASALAFVGGLTTADTTIQRVEGTGALPGALLVRTALEDPNERLLEIVFQTGPVIAVIRMLDYRAQEPTVQEAESLASRQAQRIETALQQGTLGLGNKVPRFIDAEFQSFYEIRVDQYMRINGQDQPRDLEEPEFFANRVARTGNATDSYEFIQFIQEDDPTDPPLPSQFGWSTRILRFNDDAAASAWLTERPDQVEAEYAGTDETVQDLQVLADSPVVGDESITVSYSETNGFTSQVFRTFVRVANTVADARLSALASLNLPRAYAETLASLQAQCLVNSCPEPMVLTDALSGQVTIGVPATGTPQPGPAATPPTERRTVFDLAAMTLQPSDLDVLGLPGYGMDFGVTIFPDEIISDITAARGLPEADVRQIIEGAGLEQRYENYLYLPEDSADPGGVAGRLIVSYVLEFADDAGAAAAWTFMEDESGIPTAADVPLTEALGDQSEATRDQGQDAQTGETFEQLDLTFQVGNLHAGVAIVDWMGQEPQVAEAEMLARRLLERVEVTRQATAAGLYGHVVRLIGEVVIPSIDSYYLLDSEPVRLYGESQLQTIRNDFVLTSGGRIDGYQVHQQIDRGTDAPEDDVWFMLDASRFEDEAMATAWLAGTQQRIGSNSAFADFEVVQTQTFGDESISYTVSSADGQSVYRGVSLRVGAVVVAIDVIAPQLPSAATVEALAQIQAACLIAGGCADPLPVPGDLA